MKACRQCGQSVAEQAFACPQCGAPYPAKQKWDGWGFEYKSEWTMFGLPVLHISFKYRPDRVPVPAKGIIAIGQFAFGAITISQFGVGLLSLGQFTVAAYSIAQFSAAYALIAQFGVYLHYGRGQFIVALTDILRRW